MRKNICVYCGASMGNTDIYAREVEVIGKQLALANRTLVYGGGSKGLMGIVADAVINNGGDVVGVIPERLVVAETAHKNLTTLHVVDDMHDRKSKMIALSDAFIALPGGIGTLEELFEVWTWSQIGYHDKPVAILNINNFYNPLLSFLKQMANQGFVRQHFLDTLFVGSSIDELLNHFDSYQPHNLQRWSKNDS